MTTAKNEPPTPKEFQRAAAYLVEMSQGVPFPALKAMQAAGLLSRVFEWMNSGMPGYWEREIAKAANDAAKAGGSK